MIGAKCLLGADFFWYGEIDTARMRASAVFDSSGSYGDDWSRYMLEGPVLSHWKWPEPGLAAKISDYVSQSELHRTDVYDSYLRRFGFEHTLCAPLLRTPSLIVGIGFDREARDFSEEERCALMLLSLHLSKVREQCESSSIARTHQPVIQDDLSVTKVELIVVGRDGRVRSMSSRAAELIQRYVGEFPRFSPRLPAQLEAHVIKTVDGTVPPRSSLYFRDLGDSSDLVVFVMNDGDQVSLYLRHYEQLSNEMLAKAIGSPSRRARRAEVARHLYRGSTKAEIAKALHISLGTVRKHCEDLYRELDVTRQVEAVHELRRRVAEYWRQREEG